MPGGAVAAAALECPRRLIQKLCLPGVNLVRVHLIALRRSATVACYRSASSAIFAFSAASIFRFVLCVILRSVGCDRTTQNSISQPVRFSGSTSVGGGAMTNAMLDPKQEGDSYRRVEVIMGQRWRPRWTGEEKARIVVESLK